MPKSNHLRFNYDNDLFSLLGLSLSKNSSHKKFYSFKLLFHGTNSDRVLFHDKIKNSNSNVIVIDGVRSNEEIQVLRKIGTVKLLSVHASTDTRYNFLSDRKRSDDPKNRENFDERDSREIGVGISTPIALADESISNNNLTIDELIENAYKIIQGWQK